MHTFSSMKRNCQQVSKSQFIKQSIASEFPELKAKNSRQTSIIEQNSENKKEFNEDSQSPVKTDITALEKNIQLNCNYSGHKTSEGSIPGD